MGTVLGIDPGTRFIGLAISNPERTLAFPLDVLDATPKKKLLDALKRIATDREVEQLVVGRPLALRGTPLPMTAIAEALSRDLASNLSLPVELVDERLSSKESAVTAPSGARVDAHAATLFLQTYLDRTQTQKDV